MLGKINKLIMSIGASNPQFAEKLRVIASKAKLTNPIDFMVINKSELESMTNPDLAKKDIGIGTIEIDI